MSLHRCTDAECPHAGQRTDRECRCHKTDGQVLTEQRDDLLGALEQAAEWFEEYATEHYRKALVAPDGREQHGREVKGKLNRERAIELRAAIAKWGTRTCLSLPR